MHYPTSGESGFPYMETEINFIKTGCPARYEFLRFVNLLKDKWAVRVFESKRIYPKWLRTCRTRQDSLLSVLQQVSRTLSRVPRSLSLLALETASSQFL